jgi:GntR family transcriptional regulator, arabinose operon transcriptional repressor
MPFSKAAVRLPKYQQVVETVKSEILSGRYRPGQKLPSEAALVKRFGASRITVGRGQDREAMSDRLPPWMRDCCLAC